LYETAFGMPLGDLIDTVAGGSLTGRPVKAVQVGGPLGAYMPRSKFDTPFGYKEFDGQGGLIGQAGMVVFDDSTDMLGMARFAMEFCAVESCGKCTRCHIGAVRGVETIDRIGKGDVAAIELLEDLCETMKDGSLCALGGHTVSSPECFAQFPRRLCDKEGSCRMKDFIISNPLGYGYGHAPFQINDDGHADC
jgi:formate dehydrogenase iron-sulfur subunit